MLRRALPPTIALAALACAPPRPATVEIADAPPGALPHDPGEPAPAAAMPVGPGCSFRGSSLFAHAELIPLCFAVDEACFGAASAPFRGAVTLAFPEGDPASRGARLDLAAEGVRLHAWTAGDVPVVFPKVPVVFGGAALSRDGANLRVERVRNGAVELLFRPATGVKLLRGDLRSRASCVELDVEPGEASEEAVRSVVGRSAGASTFERRVMIGQPLTIAEREDGAGVVEVTAEEEADASVEVLSQRGPRSRILWWQGEAIYFGWVDTSALHDRPASRPGPGVPGKGTGFAGPPPPPGTICPMDVPLTAEVAGTRAEVGVIEKGARFDVLERQGGDARVELRAGWLTLEGNARWIVPGALLLDCSVQ